MPSLSLPNEQDFTGKKGAKGMMGRGHPEKPRESTVCSRVTGPAHYQESIPQFLSTRFHVAKTSSLRSEVKGGQNGQTDKEALYATVRSLASVPQTTGVTGKAEAEKQHCVR